MNEVFTETVGLQIGSPEWVAPMNSNLLEPLMKDQFNIPSPDLQDNNNPLVLIEAEDGEQAMSVADKGHPDLLLLDLRIPVLDGLTVTRLIRSHPVLKEVPIVLITGMDTPQVHREALSAGCNECLIKPLDFERLQDVIKLLARSTPRSPALRSRYSLVVRSRGAICSS